VETHGLFLIKQFAGLMTGHIRRHFQQNFLKCVIKLRENVKLVVDPFVGIGSSAVASMNLNKSFMGFDVDNFYLDITAKRLEPYRRLSDLVIAVIRYLR
jgi:DNA modification methylase